MFEAIFFVILILMGFNVMTGGFAGNSFNIIVNDTGSVMVTVTSIYISNLSPTGFIRCSGSNVCIIDPVSPTNCAGNGNCVFTNANVQVEENNHNIHVAGLTIKDGSGYKLVLSSSRGRQFSFYYPWPVNIFGPSGASNSNDTDTAHGPLDIQLSVNSFSFTQGTKTISQPSWNIPYRVNGVFWIKVCTTMASIQLPSLNIRISICFASHPAKIAKTPKPISSLTIVR